MVGARASAVAIVAVLLLATGTGCATRWRASFAPPSAAGSLDHEAPYLKAHLRDGDLLVLRGWSVDRGRGVVRGLGLRYGPQRRIRAQGRIEAPLADVVLFETNAPETVRRDNLVVLAVASGASLAMTAICLLNPKACFGSCPTFYVEGQDGWSLRAEGFSASVARVLEATDVDALEVVDPPEGRFDVQMTNEALETHVVRSVRVLAVPRGDGARVLRAGDGTFRVARALAAPRSCAAAEGDCLPAVAAADGTERTSPADPEDLAARETIELAFPHPEGPAGVALVARNTLLNTFVFYQLLAYMGRDVGDFIATLETMGPGQLGAFGRVGALLAEVEVQAWTGDEWVRAGKTSEVGPIARETQMVVLPEELPPGDVRVRLILGRGSWRLDRVALATLGPPAQPVVLEPVRATRGDRDAPEVIAALRDDRETVVHYPGDAVTLTYEVPAGPQELFLESRGYYYEWMRPEWLREHRPFDALRGLADPEGLLRRLAPAYKRIEPQMDRIFWSTRIGRGPR